MAISGCASLACILLFTRTDYLAFPVFNGTAVGEKRR